MRGILIIIISGLIAAGFFSVFSDPLADADSIQYDRLGYNLVAGKGFSLDDKAPYEPTMFREPGYPAFLALVYTCFGHYVRIAVFIQVILHSLTAALVYGIARGVFSPKSAFLSGLGVALFPTLANSSSYIMSETFFTFLLCLVAFLLLKALKARNAGLFLITGITLGALILTKTAAMFLPVFIVAAIIAIGIREKMPPAKISAHIVCLLLTCALAVSAWSARNKYLFDTFSPAARGGDVLWSRAEKIDDSPREILITSVASFSEYLGKVFFPDTLAGKGRYLYKDLDRVSALKEQYMEEGLQNYEADSKLTKEATEKILSHPLRYLMYTPVEAIKMTAFTFLPFFNEDRVYDYFGGLKNGGLILSAIKGLFRIVAYPLVALFIAGVIFNLKIWNRWLILFSVILYFNLIYSLLDTIGRYAVPLIPFYCIFAAAFFCRKEKSCI